MQLLKHLQATNNAFTKLSKLLSLLLIVSSKLSQSMVNLNRKPLGGQVTSLRKTGRFPGFFLHFNFLTLFIV